MSHQIGIVRLAALAAFLLVAAPVLDQVVGVRVSTAVAQRDTQQFLDDIARHQRLTAVLLWLAGIGALLLVPLFAGLYHAPRRFGEQVLLLMAASSSNLKQGRAARFTAATREGVSALHWKDGSTPTVVTRVGSAKG